MLPYVWLVLFHFNSKSTILYMHFVLGVLLPVAHREMRQEGGI
jgi:hypothetical protein